MATLNRMRVEWGPPAVVGPAVGTFYFSGSMTGIPAAVVAFYNAIKAFLPSGMSWTIPSSGDTLEDSTGALTGAWTASGGGTVTATGGGGFAAGAGARVVWNTANVFKGRRVRGTTYVVPLISVEYDTSGTITNTDRATIETAANALITATTPNFRVWSRPDAGGAFAVSSITSATVPDKVSTLRSRRV